MSWNTPRAAARARTSCAGAGCASGQPRAPRQSWTLGSRAAPTVNCTKMATRSSSVNGETRRSQGLSTAWGTASSPSVQRRLLASMSSSITTNRSRRYSAERDEPARRRAVVMMLVLLDASRQTFTVASVGDIELRVWGGPERLALVPRRGVVGLRAPAPATAEHPFSPRTVLVMHSDGLRSRWDFSDFPWIAHETASVAAQRLLAALARDDDDATVLVVRNMPS